MTTRLELHNQLLKFSDNVYYQPPSTIRMRFPCIVYNKSDVKRLYSNDGMYSRKQQYQITVISPDPDSLTAEELETHFEYCKITNYLNVDNLHNTHLTIYY